MGSYVYVRRLQWVVDRAGDLQQLKAGDDEAEGEVRMRGCGESLGEAATQHGLKTQHLHSLGAYKQDAS